MRDLTFTEKKINRKVGKAISDYGLISEGDRILVAVSGGKDSFVLLHMLKMIKSWAPVKFDIHAVHITTDLGCSKCPAEATLERALTEAGIECFFSHIDVLDDKGRTSCFWCSWNKRKAIFETARKNSFNKVAFGHHKDDIAETFLLNLFFNGEISAMNPKQELFKGQLTIIRPLCYVEEDLTRACALEKGFPKQECDCPFGEISKRRAVKEIIAGIENNTPGTNVKTNIFNAVDRVRRDYIDLRPGDEAPGQYIEDDLFVQREK